MIWHFEIGFVYPSPNVANPQQSAEQKQYSQASVNRAKVGDIVNPTDDIGNNHSKNVKFKLWSK
jgi:hypothetical protein